MNDGDWDDDALLIHQAAPVGSADRHALDALLRGVRPKARPWSAAYVDISQSHRLSRLTNWSAPDVSAAGVARQVQDELQSIRNGSYMYLPAYLRWAASIDEGRVQEFYKRLRLPFRYRDRGVRSSPLALPISRDDIVGRDHEVQHLTGLIKAQETRIAVVFAMGGAGKTSVARRTLARLAEIGWGEVRTVFEWSFYRQGIIQQSASSDEFFERAFEFFDVADVGKLTQIQRGLRLADLVQEHHALVVLDGLETLQRAAGEEQAGRIYDAGIENFLVSLARNRAGFCLITTRVAVAGLSEHSVALHQMRLGALDRVSGARVLLNRGVRGSQADLEAAAAAVDCLPLALSLLAGWLQGEHGGNVSKYEQVDLLGEDFEQGGHAHRLMARYHAWLGKTDNEILSLLGYFDRPVSLNDAEVLLLAISDTATAKRAASTMRRSAARLKQLGLLQQSGDDITTFDCHPIVRAYESQAARTDADRWKKGHKALFLHFASATRDRPDNRIEMLKLYQAVFHGIQADLQNETWEQVVEPRMWRYELNYSTNFLGLLAAEHQMARQFFEEPFDVATTHLSEDNAVKLLSQTAFVVSSQMNLQEAVGIQRSVYEVRSAQQKWNEASTAAGSAAEYCLVLGSLGEAGKFAEAALEANRHGAIPRWQIAGLCVAAAINHEQGHKEESAKLVDEARAINVAEGGHKRWLERASGFNALSCELDLIDDRIWLAFLNRKSPKGIVGLEGTLQECREWADYCLGINEASPIPIYDGWFNLAAGRVALLQSEIDGTEPDEAIEFFTRGKQSIYDSNLERFLPLADIHLASTYRARHFRSRSAVDLDLFEHHIASAQAITRFGPMLRYDLRIELERMKFALSLPPEKRPHRRATSNVLTVAANAGFSRLVGQMEATSDALAR